MPLLKHLNLDYVDECTDVCVSGRVKTFAERGLPPTIFLRIVHYLFSQYSVSFIAQVILNILVVTTFAKLVDPSS